MSNENNHENMENHQAENPPLTDEDKTEISTRYKETTANQTSPKIQSTPEPAPREVKNTGIAIKNAESESLKNLLVYDSDSSSSSEMMKLNLNWQKRNDSEDSSSSSSSSSSSEEEDDSETDTEEEPAKPIPSLNRGAIKKDKLLPKADGELSMDELPPVPDLSKLSINVDNENFVHMGSVLGIVDKLVTVAAIPNTPAYDLDTLLFLDNGKRPLGFVFDVLGQVTSPIYAIRFNSAEDIKKLQVEVGTKVYSAPTSKHTQYVFLQQLLKMKGSDASWLGDNEVPPEFADYSDDENECNRRFGNLKLAPHLKRTHSSDSHKKFESTMNKRNLLNTKFNKYMDSYRQARLNKTKAKRMQASQINPSMMAFDPSIPPPNLRPYHHFGGQEVMGLYYDGRAQGENNNSGGQSQGFPPHFFVNNFVANLSQTNSANYFTNHAGNNHPGPSHE